MLPKALLLSSNIYNNKILSMKILNTSLGFGKPMTERQLEDFLDKSILQMHIENIR